MRTAEIERNTRETKIRLALDLDGEGRGDIDTGVVFFNHMLTLLKKHGCTNIRLMCLVAAPEGLAKVQEAHPDVDIYVAAVDDHLNENAYIVPGLGDAGDRIFGTK